MNNSTAVFIYDGKEILAETTTEGTKTNIFGNNMIATTGTDTLYYQYNNHGDVVRVLDRSGTLKNEYDYDAFGNAITEKETVKNPYRYAGYYQDTKSGLYYLRSRYYNPKTARFLTEDTASGKYTDPLSLNKYTYCHNQPVTGYDPDGHALNLVAGAIGAGVGALIGGAFSYASQAWQNKSFTKGIDWKQVAGGAAEGAISGAIGGLTMGASLAATAGGTAVKAVGKASFKSAAKAMAKNAIIDGASGFAGNTASQLITGGAGNYSVTQAVTSGVVEALNIPGGPTGEKTAKKVGSEVFDKVTDAIGDKAGREVAEEAGSKSLAKALDGSGSAGVNGTGPVKISGKQVGIQSDNDKLDYDLIKAYKKDVESRTGRKLHKKQIRKIKDVLRNNVYNKLSPEDNAFHRAKFTQSVKNKCIDEWEKNTGQIWPRYVEPVYDKKGKIIRRVGDPYDAHHLIENSYGGDHEWWNMHPAKFPNEHQGGIHGKGAPASKLYK